MNLLLEFAIKISLVIAVGLLAAWLLKRRSAALRHWMLASAVAMALATPLLMRVAPSWTLPAGNPEVVEPDRVSPSTSSRAPRIGITTTVDRQSTSTAPAAGGTDLALILAIAWITGVAVNLAGLLFGFWRLHRTAARAAIVRDGPWALRPEGDVADRCAVVG
jgi:hypothetical protein